MALREVCIYGKGEIVPSLVETDVVAREGPAVVAGVEVVA